MKNITFDFNNMFKENVEGGFLLKDIDKLKELKNAYKKFFENSDDMMGWTHIPFSRNEVVEDILKTADEIRKKYENFVVLGIGGSALSAKAYFNAFKNKYYNLQAGEKRNGPKFFVEDNIDPESLNSLLEVINAEKTVFNVVTKSGSTSETMSQFLIISETLKKKLGKNYNKNIIATTSDKKGMLWEIAQEENFKTFIIPESIGGRFSNLTSVGLLPAAVLGIDIKKLIRGEKDFIEACKTDDIHKNPALMSAALKFLCMKKGINISVMMPYSDSLSGVAEWYCQLWAESLGKEKDLNGKIINAGQTPVKAVGATDQHSQLQLYSEGPFDKVITFIGTEKFRNNIKIPKDFENYPDLNFLCGNTLSKLLNSEMEATEFALAKAGRLNNSIILPEINEYYMGQLLMFFKIEVTLTGYLLNLNPFNQPGVEESKNAAYALFGRKGYEAKKKEMELMQTKSEKYFIELNKN